MRAIIFTVASLGLATSHSTSPPDLTWLSGDWIQCSSTSVVEEHWLSAAPGELVSVGLTRELKTDKYSYEFVRIGRSDDGWAYFANPSGQTPTRFSLTELGPSRAVFENPQHDFPTRVVYWRQGAALNATIEGPGGKGLQRWTYRRNDGSGCGG